MSCFTKRARKVHFEAFPRTLWFLRLFSSKMDHKDTPRRSYSLVLAFTKLLTLRFLSMLIDSACRRKGMLNYTAFL